ncbi:LLM class F420-dependent oxidoreductase [Streptomyces minutiscleroticus]|uniref:LLM class F420-dependent oxidoreductase n=1 Tax=Streptomyces minutiscleroticus TaxID=68238 RepID=UPI003327FB11
MPREFRFGVNLLQPASDSEWAAKCRRAEELGYDIVHVPDHLGWPAPFPSLVAAAHATERVRLGTFVLNAAFWNPALLAREVATTDRLTGGRLEVGLGAGYVREEFEAAGVEFGTPGSRFRRLEAAVEALDRLLPDESHEPGPVQRPRPPLLVGGNGDRVLRLAARRAQTVAFTSARADRGTGGLRAIDAGELQERVALARRLCAEYGTDPELNLLVQQVVVTEDREAAARELRRHLPYMTVEDLLDHPILLVGTVKEIAERLHAHRERYGFTYITVLEPYMDAFGEVIGALRGRAD